MGFIVQGPGGSFRIQIGMQWLRGVPNQMAEPGEPSAVHVVGHGF